jgi:polyisoprenoid-binding protein YceI
MITATRRIRSRSWLSALFLILLLCTAAAAAESIPPGKLARLKFDPAKTTIDFSLSGWPHSPKGTFKLKRGVIRVDPINGKMDGAIVVDAASGDSGNSIRDARMKHSVLDVQRYPDINFAPDQVESHGNPQGEFPVVVRGVMSLHGGQHPFTIAARVRREGDQVSIKCSFAIPYVAWGLENPSILMFTVSKHVHVDVSATADLSWVSPTPSRRIRPEPNSHE